MVINPMLCIIFGILGGVIGSWVLYSLGFNGGISDLMSLLLEIGAGLACSLFFLLLIAIFGRGEDY